MEALADLDKVQTRILQRITNLELSLLPDNFSDSLSLSSPSPAKYSAAATDSTTTSTEGRLSAILHSNGVNDFIFKSVPYDYYDWPLEARRDVLGAASINHLCKSIVLYTARFNAETVKNFLYVLNNGQISKKKFNMRLAPEEISVKLTGYEHNAVTCIGMETDIPVISMKQL